MDDLERELMILDMQEECTAYDKSRADELARNPAWWNINLGLVDSTLEQQEASKVIFNEFSKFKSVDEYEAIESKFIRFAQFKLFNGSV